MKTGIWHKDRFIYSAEKVECLCAQCGRKFWLPASKAGKYKTCSEECSRLVREHKCNLRKRNCVTCGKEFYPRTAQLNAGLGKYCSNRCNSKCIEAAHTKEVNEKRAKSFLKAIDDGRVKILRGEDNPYWKGGAKASRQRAIINGKAAARIREYRKKNPLKVRDWASKRNSGMTAPRLPHGTTQNLMILQRNKCAICKRNVKNKFHVDHIYPISKGGKHSPENLQLLCPKCNLEKNAKDPIKFMQSKGYLL